MTKISAKINTDWTISRENLPLPREKFTTYKKKTTKQIFLYGLIKYGGPDSSVGIATGYGLDGQGIESRWRRDFSHMSRPALGSTQPPVQCVPDLSRG
jgi:hypothetical protein